MKKQTPVTSIRFRRKPLITALEPRILLDGAAVATTAEMTTDVAYQDDAVHTESAEQSVHFAAPAPTGSEPGNRREVAFVDTAVEDYQSLVDGLGEGVEVILIDGSENGLEQMVAALQGQSGIDAIHLFSHGDVGELKLGTLTLNDGTLQANAELLSTLGESLIESGDLMLYGCYVGADSEGQSFIDTLAELTQADVAASEDLTGAADKGGDWELEVESGSIETEGQVVQGFSGQLGAPSVNNLSPVTINEGDAAVKVDTNISFSGSSQLGGGYIEFRIDSANTDDQFDLLQGGNISIVGDQVYHSGTYVGVIDSVYNGQNGNNLRINFESNFANPSFENSLSDWTIGESRVILGTTIINGHLTPDDLTDPPNSGDDAGGVTSMTYSSQWASDQKTDGDYSLRLYNSGQTTTGYDVVHGPYAFSKNFQANAGDTLYFDWRAAAGGDAYDAYGYMMKADGSEFVKVLDATGANDTGVTNWATQSVVVPTSGDWYFVFVAGTYDFTGLRGVGGSLYIDNFQVFGDTVNDSVLTDLARQVEYQNTGNDSLETRNLTVSVVDRSGDTGSATTTLTINQANNAPAFTGNSSLAAVSEDTTAPSGNTVGSLFNSRYSDPDAALTPADTLAGIIITADASDPAEGEWQYSTNGSDWYSVGTVTSDAGLLLSNTSSLRFVPAADYSGTPGSLSVHAVDSSDAGIGFTSGITRATFDTTVPGNTGGITAVSSSAVSLVTSITPVDDAPVLDAPSSESIDDTDQLDTFTDVTGTLTASDIDTNTTALRFGIQGGQVLVADVSLEGSYGTLKVVKETGEYTYTPNSAAINALSSTATDTFTVTVADGTTTVSQTLTFNINGTNDAPVFGTIETVDTTTTPPDMGGGTSPEAGVEALDNGLLRFGDGVQESLNAITGMLEQPWYYENGTANKLTFSNYALNFSLGVNGDGTNDWNLNGDVNLAPQFSNVTVDTSGFSNGSGTLIWRGDITINGAQLQLSHVYTLPAGSAFLETRTYITNIGANDATNLRVWVGTQDDYIAGNDRPAKQKGNLVGGEFDMITSAEQQAQAIKIYSADTAVLFFSTSEKANTIIGQHYGWDKDDPNGEDTPSINPEESAFNQASDDGGYALFVRLDDLAVGESQSFDWYYAAGSSEQIDAIIGDVAAAASANLVEGSSQLVADGEYVVSDVDTGDVVTVTPTGVSAQQRDAGGNPIALGNVPDEATLLSMLSITPETVVDAISTSGNFDWTFDAGSEGFDFLAQGETLALTYTLTADDGNGGTAEQTVEIIIEGINDAPVAQPGAQNVAENGLYAGNVPDASDVDGTIASYELVNPVSIGSVSLNSNGSYEFNPGTAFDDLAVGDSRQVSFTYQATDNSGAISEAATVTLTVVGSNDVPVVSAGAVAVGENGQINSSVPTATDVDGTIAGYQVVTDVSSGSLTFNTNGTYNFNPGSDFDDLAAGESRQVSFTYTATDNDGGVSAPGMVTFTITGTNDAPTVTAEAAAAITEVVDDSSAQNLSDSGEVSFGDLDTTDVVDITFVSNNDIAWSDGTLDGGLAAALVAGFTIPATTDAAAPGSVNWTYAVTGVDLDFLAVGETLTFSYTITATDSQNATDTDTVTFTITGTNDAPTVTAEAAAAITEVVGDSSAQNLSDSGEVSFGDLDTTDVVDITFVSNNDIAWSDGTLDGGLAAALVAGFTIPATTDAAAPGSVNWTYAVTGVDLDFLAVGETLTFSYTITATDSQNATDTDTVTFTITGTNDAPTVTAEAAAAITEVVGDSSAQNLSDTGAVNFGDLDTTDVVDITFASNNDIAWSDGTLDGGLAAALVAGFTIPATTDAAAPGSVNWTYAVTGVDLDFLAVGETLTFSYTITATDSQNATDTDTVTFTITGTNDAPTIAAAIADIDYTEAVDASAQGLSTNGTLSFDDLDATDVVDITSEVFSAAVWSAGTIEPGLKSQLEAGLSISGTGVAAPGSVGWSYSIADADLDFLAAGETLTLTYRVTVTDSEGATATDDVTITITGTNDVPEVTADDAGPFTESADASAQALSDSGKVDFTDKDLTDDIDISFVSNDDIVWARQDNSVVAAVPADLVTTLIDGFSVGAENQPHDGQVNWTYTVAGADLDFLNAGDTITFSYTVTAEDSQGATDNAVVTVTLVGTNDAPEITARVLTDDETIVQQGADYTIEVASLFSDKDSTLSREDLDFNITGLPAGLIYNAETGLISGKPTESGLFTITVTAIDTEGSSVNRSYEMTVTAVVQAETPAAPGETGSPSAPDTDTQPVETPLSDMPDGLVNDSGSTTDPTSGSGFMEPSGDAAGPASDSVLDAGNDGNEVEMDAGEPVAEPREDGDQVDGATEQVILSEPGALVVQTQSSDGNTSMRASIDVNVSDDGQVVFSDIQQEAFSTISLVVVSIGQTADNELTIAIQDTSPTASSQVYSGSLSSGEHLPSWISLDPNTGSVTLSNPPAGQKEVSIRIQAMGADGQIRILELKLDLDELLKRSAVTESVEGETAQPGPIGFMPLSDQLETELAARDQYGDRLMALLHSA